MIVQSLALASMLLGAPQDRTTKTSLEANDDRDVIQSALLEHFYPWANEFATTKYVALRVDFGDWDRKRLKEGREPFKRRIDELVHSIRSTVNQNRLDQEWARAELATAQKFEAVGNRTWIGRAYRAPAIVAFDKMAWNPRIRFATKSIPFWEGESYGLDLPSYSPDGSVAIVRITLYYIHFSHYTFLMQRQRSGWVTLAVKEDHFV